MAYTHSKYEVEMVPAQNAAPSVGGVAWPTALANGIILHSTTVNAKWGPGYVPHIIRGAAVISLVTTAFTGGPVGCQFQADISVAGTPTTIFTISLPNSGAAHKAVYHTPTYFIEIQPGHTVEFHVTTAATAGVYAKVMLYVEPRWEEAANVTSMREAT